MKKTIVFAAVAAFLVLSGCGRKSGTPEGAGQNQTQPNQVQEAGENQANGENKITGSLKDLLGMGKALKCESSTKTERYNVEGVTYVSGEKIRSDATSQIQGAPEKTISHIIIKDGWMYNWNEGSGKGTKINMSELEKETQELQAEANQSEGEAASSSIANDDSDFSCSPWLPDESIFALPANVQFADETQILSDPKNQVEQKNGSMCDYCDKIQNADAKAQCESACREN